MAARRSMSTSEFLTSDDLAALADAVAAGKQPTVYLREGTPSLGLVPGTSARVLAVAGTTLTIKPRGVDDELPYEADELRTSKNPPPQPEKPTSKPRQARAATPRPVAAPSSRPQVSVPQDSAPPSKTPKTARRTGIPKPPTSVTVTIHGSADNKWSVTVTRGGRKPARSRSISPEAVESAMRGLADDAATQAAASVLHAARDEARKRVDQLSRELAAAQEALAKLG